jgi:hypothetical protein
MLGAQVTTEALVRGADWGAAEGERPKPFDFSERFWLKRPYYSDAYAQEVIDRFGDFGDLWRNNTPVSSAVMQAYRQYHGIEEGSAEPAVTLLEAGENGEFLALIVNHYRGLLRHQIALVTADRPTWDPQARTSGAEAARQVSLTRNLLDFVMSAKRFDQKLYDQFEGAGVCGAAFQALGWDPTAAGGRGDIWAAVLMPWECCHEQVREYADVTWWIFRRMENRWAWVAHFAETDPEKAERIADHDLDDELMCGVQAYDVEHVKESDRIPVLYVYANPTKACPEGRLSIVAGANADLILMDGPMPYGDVSPITRICPAEFVGTCIPYGNSWTQLPIQKAFTACVSAIMSRVDMFGVPNVASQEGVEFEAGDLGGANSLKFPPGAPPPSVLDLLTIPGELPGFADSLKQAMEELSGINSVTRGNPTENISSGSMAALLQSMAIQFNSADERAYTFNLEAIGTFVLRIYQRMATMDQLVSIAGQDEQWTAQSFKAEDLQDVQRVAVKTASALSRNIAGRKELADNLLMNKMIEDPREYLQIIETGNLSPVFRGPINELTNVKAENEMMLRGETPHAVLWDNHSLHIREHRGELDTKARYDQRLAGVINTHLMEHFNLWSQMSRESPDMLAAIGVQPLPQAMATGQAAMQAQMMPGAPPQNGPPPQETPNAVDQEGPPPGPPPMPPGQEPPTGAPNLPNMPSNPTGAPV